MIIYCDGSSKLLAEPNRPKHSAQYVLGWGIKAEHGEHGAEIYGAVVVPYTHCALHEYFAFVEAVIYASTHNGNTLNTTIITDYIGLCGANELGVKRFEFNHLKNIKSKFKQMEKFYTKSTLDLALDYVLFASVKWVKGHSTCVNNARADWLATHGRVLKEDEIHDPLMKGKPKKFVPFEQWLRGAICRQPGSNGKKAYHAPFNNVSDQELANIMARRQVTMEHNLH